jgi:RND family efflux transporter MFP subunit
MSTDINTETTAPLIASPAEYTGTAVSPHHGHVNEAPASAPVQRDLPPIIWVAVAVVGILLAAAVIYGILSRASAERHLDKTTQADAVMSVQVTRPTVNGTASEIALPGNTQAYNDTPIYARTAGYLKQWFVDIGGHVKQGELMAIIETPEVDQQLQVAEADLKSAQANLSLANITSERYQSLLKSDSVSKQETDTAIGGAAARKAAVDAAEADVRRLQQLQSFERVYAPFAGIVTVRNTDIGALINAGSASGATPQELFRIASIDKLRVFAAVPETYAPAIRDGDTATLTLDEYPGQQFTGTIARNSSAIDPASRTLNVEVDVNNANGKLLPGAYAFVHFKLPQDVRLLSVPANTLLFRAEGLRVGIVRDGHVHLQPVTIGKDNGATLAISTGVTENDEIIVDPSDSLTEGEQVSVTQHPAVAK